MMNLRQVVERYESLAKSFGEPVALKSFGLSALQTSNVFTALDEDYHISRFLKFDVREGENYTVSGNAVTHVCIEKGILALL